MEGGIVKCWGPNHNGQLGDGSQTDSAVPVQVTGITEATEVSLGDSLTCTHILTTKNSCWGSNPAGPGDGSTTQSNIPIEVTNISSSVSMSVGAFHACNVRAPGTVQCWGHGSQGRLGNGTTTSSATPVDAIGISTATAFDGGIYHGCARLADSSAQCWGQGGSGRLGTGGTDNALTPQPVLAGLCRTAPDPGFGDVPSGSYYENAVAWLAAMGISTGTGPGAYSPNDTVSRAQMAVFLHRAFGSPTGSPPHSFADVPSGSYYTDAVSWLVDQGITSGTGPGTYSPNANVNRAQIAVFLNRRGCGAG
ncbi:MAG: S-layer homology domain-containing protein [Microthrixaceae bacterium]